MMSISGSALCGRAGTPPDVLAKLNAAVNKALQNPELIAAFAKFGLTPARHQPAEGAAFTKSEYEKWKKVIDDGHITLDEPTRTAHRAFR